MKTIADIKAIRDAKQAQLNLRKTDECVETSIVVGLATCGISAGAREVFNVFIDETSKAGLDNVKVKRAGCLGICKLEPMIEVTLPDQEKCTYILVTPEKARRIFSEHIVGGRVVTEYLISNE